MLTQAHPNPTPLNSTLSATKEKIYNSDHFMPHITYDNTVDELGPLLARRDLLKHRKGRARGFVFLRASSAEAKLTAEDRMFPFTVGTIEAESVQTRADTTLEQKADGDDSQLRADTYNFRFNLREYEFLLSNDIKALADIEVKESQVHVQAKSGLLHFAVRTATGVVARGVISAAQIDEVTIPQTFGKESLEKLKSKILGNLGTRYALHKEGISLHPGEKIPEFYRDFMPTQFANMNELLEQFEVFGYMPLLRPEKYAPALTKQADNKSVDATSKARQFSDLYKVLCKVMVLPGSDNVAAKSLPKELPPAHAALDEPGLLGVTSTHPDVEACIKELDAMILSPEAQKKREENATHPALKNLTREDKERLLSYFICTRAVWVDDIDKHIRTRREKGTLSQYKMSGISSQIPKFRPWENRTPPSDPVTLGKANPLANATWQDRLNNALIFTYPWREYFDGKTNDFSNREVIGLLMGVDARVLEEHIWKLEQLDSYYASDNHVFFDINPNRLPSHGDRRLARLAAEKEAAEAAVRAAAEAEARAEARAKREKEAEERRAAREAIAAAKRAAELLTPTPAPTFNSVAPRSLDTTSHLLSGVLSRSANGSASQQVASVTSAPQQASAGMNVSSGEQQQNAANSAPARSESKKKSALSEPMSTGVEFSNYRRRKQGVVKAKAAEKTLSAGQATQTAVDSVLGLKPNS